MPMKKRMSFVVRAFALVFALAFTAGVVAVAQAPAPAQGIAGTWQGTLAAGPGLRIILKVSRTPAGYIATMYSIDQGSGPIPVTSITLDGSAMKFAVAPLNGSYAGTLSADGNSIAGTWTQNSGPLPLNLVRPRSEEHTSELQSLRHLVCRLL